MTRHLHQDYDTTFCGKDASHILMTFDETETDCAACKSGLLRHQEEEKVALAEATERDRLAKAEIKELTRQREQREREDRERSQAMEQRFQKIEERLGLRPL